jgi:HD-like signal output (HDOD) protein
VNPSQPSLLRKLENVDHLPTLPAVLAPLLRYLEQPPENIDLQQVIELISQDKSLTAQCLHMANSPLFGRLQTVDSVRGAVMALGIRHMREIAVSCSVLKLMPSVRSTLDPSVFWVHSFSCALVSQKLAQRIRFYNPEKAYLAGLLHDLGIIAILWLAPDDFCAAFDLARCEEIPLHEAEQRTLGFSHCETGEILAHRWNLAADVSAVVQFHHHPETAPAHRSLVAIVHLADLLCRMRDLGYGYPEQRQINLLESQAHALLIAECPDLAGFDWARFTFELDNYLIEVRSLVAHLHS